MGLLCLLLPESSFEARSAEANRTFQVIPTAVVLFLYKYGDSRELNDRAILPRLKMAPTIFLSTLAACTYLIPLTSGLTPTVSGSWALTGQTRLLGSSFGLPAINNSFDFVVCTPPTFPCSQDLQLSLGGYWRWNSRSHPSEETS